MPYGNFGLTSLCLGGGIPKYEVRGLKAETRAEV